MDKRLQILESLYESKEPQAEITSGDPAVDLEARVLTDVKSLLDRTPAVRPDPSVIDSITNLAANEWRRERAPLRPVRHARIYALRMVAAASVLFAVVAVGLWQFGIGTTADVSESDDLVASEAAEFTEQLGKATESEVRRFGSNAGAGILADKDNAFAVAPASAQQDSIPSWSDPAELVLARKRVQAMLQNSRSLDWDQSMIPLEMMPSGSTTRGLQQTSATPPRQ